MTVPEALRVDTDGGIKPDMAFLALLFGCAIRLCLSSRGGGSLFNFKEIGLNSEIQQDSL